MIPANVPSEISSISPVLFNTLQNIVAMGTGVYDSVRLWPEDDFKNNPVKQDGSSYISGVGAFNTAITIGVPYLSISDPSRPYLEFSPPNVKVAYGEIIGSIGWVNRNSQQSSGVIPNPDGSATASSVGKEIVYINVGYSDFDYDAAWTLPRLYSHFNDIGGQFQIFVKASSGQYGDVASTAKPVFSLHAWDNYQDGMAFVGVMGRMLVDQLVVTARSSPLIAADRPLLHLVSNHPAVLNITSELENTLDGAQVLFRAKGRGTNWASSQGAWIGFIGFRGYDGTTYRPTSSAAFIARANEDFSGGKFGTYFTWEGTTTGTTSRNEWMRLIDGKLSIGTTAPTSLLTISANAATLPAPITGSVLHIAQADGVVTRMMIDSYGAGNAIDFRRSNGTAASPSAVPVDQALGSIRCWGFGTTIYSANARALFQVLAAEAWTDSAHGTYFQWQTTLIGTTTTNEKMRLSDNGVLIVAGITATGMNSPILWNSGTTPLSVPGVLFTQTADSTTTANTASTLFGSGQGTITLPANFLLTGRTIRIMMGGYVSTSDGGAGTKTLVLKLGGVTVATGASGAAFTNVLNQEWTAEAFITCRTTGAGGTVVGGGEWFTQISGTANISGTYAAANATAAANTTGTLAIDLTFNNGNATGAIKTTWATVEILN